jgi:hypothetical protein
MMRYLRRMNGEVKRVATSNPPNRCTISNRLPKSQLGERRGAGGGLSLGRAADFKVATKSAKGAKSILAF